MRVAVLVLRHPASRPSPVVPEMLRGLTQRGCTVEVLTPDEGVLDLAEQRPRHDLYVLKSGTESALSLAGVLHHQGARIVNPYPVAVACRDKIVQTPILQAAGVPVPQSWTTVDPAGLAPLLDDGPLIVKAPRGSQGRGITVARRPDDLAALAAGRPWLAMRYQVPDGPDHKLYRIGDEVFGVQRTFPARTFAEKLGRPFEVSPELREVVLRCGEAFGISLYGVDVVFSSGRPWVVDMSSFPGFKGVPAAGTRLADYLVTAGPAVAERAAS
jgi:ribosomal protein S6--L-glutamate ligase